MSLRKVVLISGMCGFALVAAGYALPAMAKAAEKAKQQKKQGFSLTANEKEGLRISLDGKTVLQAGENGVEINADAELFDRLGSLADIEGFDWSGGFPEWDLESGIGTDIIKNSPLDLFGVQNLEVGGRLADVVLLKSADGSASARLAARIDAKNAQEAELSITRRGSTAIVEVKTPGRMSLSNGQALVLYISLPELPGLNISISLGAGDIAVHDVEANDFVLESNAGDIVANDLKGGDLSLSADAGDIALRNIKADKLSVSADTGDIAILLEADWGVQWELRSDAGDIAALGSRDHGSVRGARGDGHMRLYAKADAGDIVVW